jgi:hypothetical protein
LCLRGRTHPSTIKRLTISDHTRHCHNQSKRHLTPVVRG